MREKLGGISLGVKQRFGFASFYVLWITREGVPNAKWM